MKLFYFLIILSLILFACGTDSSPILDEALEETDGPVSEFLSIGDYKIDSNSEEPIPIKHGDMVTGTISYIPENKHLWLVVKPLISERYYPQQGELFSLPPEDEWALNVYVGTLDAGVGEEFDLLLVLVNEEGNQIFQDYVDTAKETGDYPGMQDLPPEYEIIDSITVVRVENSEGPISKFLTVGDHEIDPNHDPNDPIPINYGDMVTGSITYIPESMHLWLIVDSIEVGRYYPQQGELIPLPPENEWALKVYVGTPDSGVGEQVKLLLVFVNGQGNQEFQDYLDTGDYPGMTDLPTGYEIINSMTVERAE
ncbi:MAG: hypothetical protein PVI90_18430 [Desulfobacteraceae bacterium]|jgi:hypothetical protein